MNILGMAWNDWASSENIITAAKAAGTIKIGLSVNDMQNNKFEQAGNLTSRNMKFCNVSFETYHQLILQNLRHILANLWMKYINLDNTNKMKEILTFCQRKPVRVLKLT